MSKKYIVAIIFKNGMKLCSKPLSRGRAKEVFNFKRKEFGTATMCSSKLYDFENSAFKVEDIFMITMVEEQKND